MLISLAVDFRRADVATRERFHLSDERIAQLYRLTRTDAVAEAAVIATCNRTELYAWLDSDEPAAADRALGLIARRWMRTRADGEALLSLATKRTGEAAAQQLVRIASGLESQVLGDGQILGQLRAAYKHSARCNAAGPVLHRLFETALRTGKRVQTETSLSAGRNSVGAEAALTASRRFGDLANVRCVVVGAGKTGQRAAKGLHKLGARDIVIVNRTADRALELSRVVGGRSATLDTVHVEAALADVVIVATGSERHVLLADALTRARDACAVREYPLLVMDLGVPRNVDPRVAEDGTITLIDLDTLQQPVESAESTRRDAVPAAEAIVDEEVASFAGWVATMPARDALRPLREALEGVARREVAFASGDDEVAERAASRIVAKLLAGPMAALRGALQRGEPLDARAMMLLEMFAPSPETPAGRRRDTRRALPSSETETTDRGEGANGRMTPADARERAPSRAEPPRAMECQP